MSIDTLNNPFQIHPPEELEPRLLYKLFVKEYTEHNALIGNYHTFIFGSRGSGKSMHFRYLEPNCQAIAFGGMEKFFSSEQPFVAIYINCNKGDYSKTEFQYLLSCPDVHSLLATKTLTHYLVMDIADCTLKTVVEQFGNKLTTDNEKKVCAEVTSWFDASMGEVCTLADLRKLVHKEKRKVDDSINKLLENSGLPDNRLNSSVEQYANTSLEEGSFLYILFTSLREGILNEDVPFYLLFDEANVLLNTQKGIINTLISARKHSLACIKVSCQANSYNYYFDINNRAIQETHDYYLIDLDSLYTTDKFSYYDRIKKIAERRLEISGFDQRNVKALLPDNPTEVVKIQEARDITAEEYDALPNNMQTSNRTDYIRKYSMARFFQRLDKTSYKYAGFDNLVHFSSGIVRSFLEPCYSMLNEYTKKFPDNQLKKIDSVPIEIQEHAINEYSNSFITKEIKEPMKLLPPDSDDKNILETLEKLLGALGELYSKRLKNPKSREPRIISFSIKETISDSILLKSLDYAVQKAFFHKKWYRAKSGHKMLECYILNRRLCPRFQLDLSSFQGRFELSEADLKNAISNPSKFVGKFEKEEEDETTQLQMFDF